MSNEKLAMFTLTVRDGDPLLLTCALEAILGSPVAITDNAIHEKVALLDMGFQETGDPYGYQLTAILPDAEGIGFKAVIAMMDEASSAEGRDVIFCASASDIAEKKRYEAVLKGLGTLAGNAVLNVSESTLKAETRHSETTFGEPDAYPTMFQELLDNRDNIAKQRALFYIIKNCKTKEQLISAMATSEAAFKKYVRWYKDMTKRQVKGKETRETDLKIKYMAYRALPYTERLCMLAYALYRQAGGTLNAPDFTDKLLNGSNAELYTPLNRAFTYVENEYARND